MCLLKQHSFPSCLGHLGALCEVFIMLYQPEIFHEREIDVDSKFYIQHLYMLQHVLMAHSLSDDSTLSLLILGLRTAHT